MQIIYSVELCKNILKEETKSQFIRHGDGSEATSRVIQKFCRCRSLISWSPGTNKTFIMWLDGAQRLSPNAHANLL